MCEPWQESSILKNTGNLWPQAQFTLLFLTLMCYRNQAFTRGHEWIKDYFSLLYHIIGPVNTTQRVSKFNIFTSNPAEHAWREKVPVEVCNESGCGGEAIMLPVQRDLLRWTECGIIATDTDCLSKYSLNSVFVFKGSLMYGDRWPRKTHYLPS